MTFRSALLGLSFAFIIPWTSLAGQGKAQPLIDGDRVLIKLWMDSIFVDTARIQEGRIILPRFGSLSVAGVPASNLPDSIRGAYVHVFRPVTIEITPLRKVTVLGEVRQPDIYFFEPGTTMREVVALAGGIPESGRTGRITIMRDSTRTQMRDWHLRTDADAMVHSGDVVFVDRESWFKRNAFTVVSGASVLLSIVITLTRP